MGHGAFGGDHSTLEIEVDGVVLEALVEGAAPAIGSSVALAIDPRGLQLFV